MQVARRQRLPVGVLEMLVPPWGMQRDEEWLQAITAFDQEGESRGQLQALAPRVGELARRVEVCVRRWLKRATAAISRSRDGTGRWPRCTTVQ